MPSTLGESLSTLVQHQDDPLLDAKSGIKKGEIATFFVLSYAISWTFLGSFVVLWHTQMNQTLTWWSIVFLPGAYGPTIAGLIVTGRSGGRVAVRALLGRVILWRVNARWYAFALLTPPALVAASMLVSGFRSDALQDFNPLPGLAIAPLALLLALPFGPLGEEVGWRGYALPRLMTSYGLWKSSLILGLAWTFWHVPMFWFPGAAIPSFLSPGPFSIALYTAQITAEACLLTFLFTVTRGSVLLAILYHASFNAAETILFRMVAEPTEAQELRIYVINIVLSWILAVTLLSLASRRSRQSVQGSR